MTRHSSLYGKLVFLCLFLSLVPVISIALFLSHQAEKNLRFLLKSKTEQTIGFADHFFKNKAREALALARMYAGNERLLELYRTGDRSGLYEALRTIFTDLKRNYGVTILEYGDEKGRVFLRVHNPEKYGDDKSENNSIAVTLSGKELGGFEFGTTGLAVRGFVPLRDGERVIGTLQIGYNLDQKLLEDLNPLISGDIALFEKDMLVQTSRTEEQANLRKHKEPEIFKLILAGNPEVEIQAKGSRLLSYSPITDPGGKNIEGMIRLGLDVSILERLQRESLIFTLVLVGLLSVLIAVLALGATRLVLKPINLARDILWEIAEGEADLTRQIPFQTRDEIGQMAESFNLTIKKFADIVDTVKKEARSLENTALLLSSNMEETAAAVHQIASNIEGIRHLSVNQASSTRTAREAVDGILESIETLGQLIEDQAASVEESSSSIEEMVANIGSVSQVLVRNSQSVEELNNAAEEGRKGIEEALSRALLIERESESLQEAGSVIRRISSQTNLLAMNAAIEAAHAGEYGKGFAVVAEEIRKLAEEAGSQGTMITTVFERLKGSIETVGTATRSAEEQFERVFSLARLVGDQEAVIKNAMEEQNNGGSQILEAIRQINEVTSRVKGHSEEMRASCGTIRESMAALDRTVAEVSSGMEEMSVGVTEISKAIHHVNDMSFQNRESIEVLIQNVSKFRTD